MRNKLIVIFFVVISVCSASSASQQVLSEPHLSSEQTNKRYLTEFCELFMRRATQLEDSGMSYGIYPLIAYNKPQIIDNKLVINITAGLASVDIDTMKIDRLIMYLFDYDESDTTNNKYSAECAISYSALEYDNLSELAFIHNSNVEDKSDSVVEEGIGIINSGLHTALTDGSLMSIMKSGKGILIYSGNYDYYIKYAELESSPSLFYLIAVSR